MTSTIVQSARTRATTFTEAELRARFGLSLAELLNSDEVVGRSRFCTPSVLTGADRVRDAYASDVSISAADQALRA